MKNKIYNILHYKLCPPSFFLWVSACPMPSLSIENQLQRSAGRDREMERQRDEKWRDANRDLPWNQVGKRMELWRDILAPLRRGFGKARPCKGS